MSDSELFETTLDEGTDMKDEDDQYLGDDVEATVYDSEQAIDQDQEYLDEEAVQNGDESRNDESDRGSRKERERSHSRERRDDRKSSRSNRDTRDSYDSHTRDRQRRKRFFNSERISDIMASNLKKQRNEVWKKTVMMGPLNWEDVEDPFVTNLIHDTCTCSLIYRKKPNDSTDCHLELRFVNHGDAANCCDKLERPFKTLSGHTIRRRTRMPLESQLQEWDQTMFSRMYMGNRVFLYVDNIPPTALKEDVFATFPSCSYITYSLKADMLTGYSVLEYRSEGDIEADLSDAPMMLHGNVLNTFVLARSIQFHDRGRPVAMQNREMHEYDDRGGYSRYDRGGYDGYDRGRYDRGRYDRGGFDRSSFNQTTSDSQSLGNLESMLLQEIGRKVMMQGSMGLLDQGRPSSSRYQSYNSRRW